MWVSAGHHTEGSLLPPPVQNRLGTTGCQLTTLCLCCRRASLPYLHTLRISASQELPPLYDEISSIFLRLSLAVEGQLCWGNGFGAMKVSPHPCPVAAARGGGKPAGKQTLGSAISSHHNPCPCPQFPQLCKLCSAWEMLGFPLGLGSRGRWSLVVYSSLAQKRSKKGVWTACSGL